MTTIEPSAVDVLLSQALRERVSDLGDEGAFGDRVLAASIAVPQRRPILRWPGVFPRRSGLILIPALLATGIIAAAIGGFSWNRPSPLPIATIDVENGPILAIETRRSWWIDSATGATLTGAGYPEMPVGIQDAAFTRDGSRLALVVDGDLELFDLESGERTIVATCGEIGWVCLLETERQSSIEWSPNATSIAVGLEGLLLLIDVQSGAITTLIEDASAWHFGSPTWSPDGAWLAFEHLSKTAQGNPAVGRTIQVVRVDGTDRHQVSAPEERGSGGAGIPAWTLDGTRILYLATDARREDGTSAGLSWTMSAMAQPVADGMAVGAPVEVAELLDFICIGWCPTFQLSPDGASLLLDSGEGMVIVPLDGGPRIEIGNSHARPLAWRPIPGSD